MSYVFDILNLFFSVIYKKRSQINHGINLQLDASDLMVYLRDFFTQHVFGGYLLWQYCKD